RILDDVPHDAFALTLDRVGEWHHAGVAWIAPSRVPGALVALHARLSESLRSGDFPIEERPFRPHLTLVRRRTRPLADAPTPPLRWLVKRVSLMRSDRVAGAIRYREDAGVALSAVTSR
ncbi:MAG TPA: 2'-5' RNA ligase family protein, partial [Casimicrobiaceae bacterium]|nr:2'-5' RNA ligase family protein [Casimicrobiaceae bacterium]